MTPDELRASLSLSSIFALRLFGMFIILPVFTLWAEGRPGWTLTLAGVALGAYGLTQGMLQLPFGWLSDRRGRKPIIYFGLVVLAAGSFLCAVGESPWVVILGRVLQGAGAISGTVIAMAADLTRESQRTKTMAIIGSTIGVVFAVSFIMGPWLQRLIGVPGIFALTGVLALAAIAVVRFVVPDPPPPSLRKPISLKSILREPELVRLNVGIFALHAVLMATFVVVPVALARAGLPSAEHAWVYLGAVGTGFVLMLPFVISRTSHRERPVFLASIAIVAVSLAVLALRMDSIGWIAAGLVIFFTGFNVLEAKLPALVSRAAPREATGAATGVYSSVQFLGTFFGGAVGGAVAQHAGFVPVLAGCLAVTAGWLAVAWNMGEFVPAATPASRT
jgi:predicted MFS family arabinose efflux permease